MFYIQYKIQKACFHLPTLQKKDGVGERKVSDPIQRVIIFSCTVSYIRHVLINKRVSPQVINWKKSKGLKLKTKACQTKMDTAVCTILMLFMRNYAKMSTTGIVRSPK